MYDIFSFAKAIDIVVRKNYDRFIPFQIFGPSRFGSQFLRIFTVAFDRLF